MIKQINDTEIVLTAPLLDPYRLDVLEAWMEFLQACGWHVSSRRYNHTELSLVVTMQKEAEDAVPCAECEHLTFSDCYGEVHWSRPGPCPVTPEQFEAIYNDEEAKP